MSSLYEDSVLPIPEPLEYRKEILLETRLIDCDCIYCTDDITEKKLIKGTHPEIQELLAKIDVKNFTMEHADILIAELQEYWNFANGVEDDPTSYDLAILNKRSDQLMKVIADLVTWPCINYVEGAGPEDFAGLIVGLNHDGRKKDFHFMCKACADGCHCNNR